MAISSSGSAVRMHIPAPRGGRGPRLRPGLLDLVRLRVKQRHSGIAFRTPRGSSFRWCVGPIWLTRRNCSSKRLIVACDHPRLNLERKRMATSAGGAVRKPLASNDEDDDAYDV